MKGQAGNLPQPGEICYFSAGFQFSKAAVILREVNGDSGVEVGKVLEG